MTARQTSRGSSRRSLLTKVYHSSPLSSRTRCCEHLPTLTLALSAGFRHRLSFPPHSALSRLHLLTFHPLTLNKSTPSQWDTENNMATTQITEASIREALIERLKASHVEVQDQSGTWRHCNTRTRDTLGSWPRIVHLNPGPASTTPGLAMLVKPPSCFWFLNVLFWFKALPSLSSSSNSHLSALSHPSPSITTLLPRTSLNICLPHPLFTQTLMLLFSPTVNSPDSCPSQVAAAKPSQPSSSRPSLLANPRSAVTASWMPPWKTRLHKSTPGVRGVSPQRSGRGKSWVRSLGWGLDVGRKGGRSTGCWG
jgi:hypothetical protein